MDRTGTTVYLCAVALGYICSGFILGVMWALNHVAKG